MTPRFIFVHGRIYTMDQSLPLAEAVAVDGDRVAAVGPPHQVLTLAGPGTEVVDLDGRAVVPGFIDSHVHFLDFGLRLRAVELKDVTSLDMALERVAEACSRSRPGVWVVGGGWNKNLWQGDEFPTREHLDRVSPENPVALSSKDGHALWANSLAMARAGISAATPDPPGGKVLRDPSTGEPTGVLLENAQALLRRALADPDEQTCRDALLEAQKIALAAGLTGIHDMEGAPAVRAFQALRREGQLELRVFLGLPWTDVATVTDMVQSAGPGDEYLRTGLLKLFVDGALGAQTAHTLDPYEGRPGYYGMPTMEFDELLTAVRWARDTGLGIAVHAIGDAACRKALDAAQALREPGQESDLLYRIEHAQLIAETDIHRFASLGVVASMQPIHATSDMELAERHWGRRTARAYAWRSLIQAGTTLAFGSDCPVEPIGPLRGIYAAVTRRREDGAPPGGWYPEQCLTVQEAVQAYTLGSAMASGEAHLKGSITPGKVADMAVLSRDIFRVPAEEILNTVVDITMVGGRIVHRRI